MFKQYPPKLTQVSGRLVAAVLFVAASGAASADIFPWTNSAGANGQFQWTSGQNQGLANLYQDPAVLDVGFLFDNPLGFRADGGGGSAASVTNLASATVITQGLGPLNSIFVHEWGTWSAGPNDDPFQVFTIQADATLTVPGRGTTQHDISADNLIFNPMDATGVGTWEAFGTLVPTTGDWNFGIVSFSNTLQVSQAAAAGSFFEKTGMVATLPEPATAVLLLLGGGPLILRRWRR